MTLDLSMPILLIYPQGVFILSLTIFLNDFMSNEPHLSTEPSYEYNIWISAGTYLYRTSKNSAFSHLMDGWLVELLFSFRLLLVSLFSSLFSSLDNTSKLGDVYYCNRLNNIVIVVLILDGLKFLSTGVMHLINLSNMSVCNR